MLIESYKSGCNHTEQATQYNHLIECLLFRLRLKIEDPVVEEIDKQVQDAANVAFQEGLLLEEEMAEEQWHLKDSVMSAFNTIFQGYKTINLPFMDLSKLIDGTPLNAMGQILNHIQESTARSVGYREGRGCGRQGRGRGS